jgi:hypothetical protein
VKRFAVAALVALAGCGPTLYALSAPPPGRTGWLDSDKDTLDVTDGVAIAFACEKHGPCRNARAQSEDPNVAEVVPAHLARLDPRIGDAWAFTISMVPATTFVVVARATGRTVIHVRSDDGDRDLTVRVAPAPAAAPVAATATATPIPTATPTATAGTVPVAAAPRARPR